MANNQQKREDFEFVNQFEIRGAVLDFGTNTFGSFLILSVTLPAKDKTRELTMRISITRSMLNRLARGDRVIVRGYTRAFSYHNTALGKDTKIQVNEATNIERATPILDTLFGEGKGFYCPPDSYVNALAGVVTNYSVSDERSPWAYVTIKTCGGGSDQRPSTPTLMFRRKVTRGSRTYYRELKVGDQIQCSCTAWTPNKEKENGEIVYLQNLIIDDYFVVNKETSEADADGKIEFPQPVNPLGNGTREEKIRKEANIIIEAEGFTPGEAPVEPPAAEPAAADTADDSNLFG